MKIKTCNKVKSFTSIYSKEKDVKEIILTIGKYQISITEHQYGQDLSDPYVDISCGDITHSMSFETFINNIFKK